MFKFRLINWENKLFYFLLIISIVFGFYIQEKIIFKIILKDHLINRKEWLEYGTVFRSLRPYFLKMEVKEAGYLTDKDKYLSEDVFATMFIQASNILAPTLLKEGNKETKFIILDYFDKKKYEDIKKELNLIPIIEVENGPSLFKKNKI